MIYRSDAEALDRAQQWVDNNGPLEDLMPQKPDAVTVRLPFAEIQDRMGIPIIESLLAERDELVDRVAPLRARHGPFGTWDALRKIELATVSATIRAEATVKGVKVTEASIEEAAHASERYADFVAQGTVEKSEWIILENRIAGIADTINRGQAVARYLASEVALSR